MRTARTPTNTFKEGQIGFNRRQVKIGRKVRKVHLCVSHLSTTILFHVYFAQAFPADHSWELCLFGLNIWKRISKQEYMGTESEKVEAKVWQKQERMQKITKKCLNDRGNLRNVVPCPNINAERAMLRRSMRRHLLRFSCNQAANKINCGNKGVKDENRERIKQRICS